MIKPKTPAGPLGELVVRDALKVMNAPTRRHFLQRGLTLGGLALLTGCDIRISNQPSIERALRAVSRFNDMAQAALFSPTRLAATYSEADITRPFPFNAFYPMSQAPVVDGETYRLKLAGLIQNKEPWSLAQLYALPQTQQITRHICVEGWSAIGSWQGLKLSDFLKMIGADTTAKYVWFQCADKEGYNSPLDMRSALHPQTQMTFKFGDEILPRAYGFPMKIRVPTKLGFKNPKYVISMEVTNDYKGGYWEDQGYNSFSGS